MFPNTYHLFNVLRKRRGSEFKLSKPGYLSAAKWPFKGTIKVSLLNQLEDGQHHTREPWSSGCDIQDVRGRVTGRERTLGVGYARFISHQDLGYNSEENMQFLKDNTLFFRVDCFEPKLD